jgi:hypothetical protein
LKLAIVSRIERPFAVFAVLLEILLVAVGGHIVGQRLVEVELAEVDIGYLAEMREPLLDALHRDRARLFLRSWASSMVSPRIGLMR